MSDDAAAKDLYRRWIEEVWNGSADAARELVSEDFVGHWPEHDVHGPGELVEMISHTHGMFTSLRFEVQVGPFAGDGYVAGRWTGRGGTDEGVAAFFGNDILRIRDGHFTEYWVASVQTG